MATYNHEIEDWWRHCGIGDREQASYISADKYSTQEYLATTDDWWESLTPEEKEKVYFDFFSEC